MTRELGDRMVEDPRFKLLTFTGSPSVGWRMKERAGKKKVVLELGGNAGVIVDATADLDWAVKRSLVGRLQLRRPGVHQRPAHVRPRGHLGRVHGPLRRRARRRSRSATRSTRDATWGRWSTRSRAPAAPQRWVDEAVALGGKVLLGGKADGSVLPADRPGRRARRPPRCARNEAFAPLVVAFPFRRPRRRHRARQRLDLRAPDGRLHQRPGARLAGVQRARGGRRDRQ